MATKRLWKGNSVLLRDGTRLSDITRTSVASLQPEKRKVTWHGKNASGLWQRFTVDDVTKQQMWDTGDIIAY